VAEEEKPFWSRSIFCGVLCRQKVEKRKKRGSALLRGNGAYLGEETVPSSEKRAGGGKKTRCTQIFSRRAATLEKPSADVPGIPIVRGG